jgi:hypothetical protein
VDARVALLTADVVSYDEAQHLLRVLCAPRWFHPSVVPEPMLAAHAAPRSPARAVAPRHGGGDGVPAAPPAVDRDALQEQVQGALAVCLARLGERRMAEGELLRAQSLVEDLQAVLDGEAPPLHPASHPEGALLANPAALRSGNKKRSPQRVNVCRPKRRRGARRMLLGSHG